MAKRKPKIKTAKAMEAEGAQEASDGFVGDMGDITLKKVFDPPTKKELDAYRKNHPLNRVGKSFTVPFRAIKKTGKTLLDKLRDRGPLYK